MKINYSVIWNNSSIKIQNFMLFHFLFDIKIVFPICKLLSIHIFPTTSPSFLIKVFPDTDKQQTSEKTARTAKSCAEIAE